MNSSAPTRATATSAGTAGTPAGTAPDPHAAAAVEVRGVTRRFSSRSGEVVALSDVDLTVRAGEFVSLIGPSGCGKSTLLRLIADLDEPTAGELSVFGRPPRVARQNHDFGIAFQQAGLLPWRSVRTNVELPLQLHGTGRGARRARATELLEMVGLADFAEHLPHQLSGGMQQRVAIARALAERPSLLLMDEPFGALDEMTREHVQTELLRLRAETGAAVVFVTHSIPEAVYLSDRVVVMSARPGQVREVVPVGLGEARDRSDDVREDDAFFDRVRAVREALHGADGTTPRGVDRR
ncbi:ABC transporter ATP-binding protein [Isoptericola sp. AK164]|uniref:ABC transporter ATP-binding protein n=1 Tax=Isoptericola sp. AK164 TaxID=3024246 RepID=UPI0024181BF1|nr:ABC transporter ATP-binding protein [Isoptericola sp. AK164]